MLLCFRNAKLLVSPRQFFAAPRSLCSKLYSLSLSQSKASDHLQEGCDDDFLPWLEQKAGVEISSVISIGRSTHGRSLFASKTIKSGSSILKVPFNAQISPDSLFPEIKILLGGDVGNVARVATVILLEKKKGPESGWAPYISRLPLLDEMQSTLFWGEDELDKIKLSSVYQETLRKKAEIRGEFLALKPVLDHFPKLFKDIGFEDFLHAYALVASRAWESAKGSSLIPLADFLNHDGLAKAVVLSDKEKQLSEVIADRDYAPGEQIWITYGKHSNAILLLEFGFTLPNNIYEEVQVLFKIPCHDPLYKMKLELFERHCFSTLARLKGSKRHVFSFTIKEVRSATGKGKGIPQSLRAAARVLCCTSAEELNDMVEEAAANDGRLGRRPFKNIDREIQAHEILLSRITELSLEYTQSVKLANLPGSTRTGPELRERMAYDLLSGELRVLISASAWLQNYISALHCSRKQWRAD